MIDTYAPEAFSSMKKNLEFCWNFYKELSGKEKIRYIRNALISAKRAVMQEVRRTIYNLLPSHQLRNKVFSEERKRYLMEENYKMRKTMPVYQGKLTLFRGEERTLKAKHRVCIDSYLGWEKLASEIEMREIHGLHPDVLKDPYALSIARNLNLCLNKSQ